METKAATTALPNDLLADIFGRLPARSLTASRRVCKAWRDVIDQRRLPLRLRHLLPHSLHGLFINYQDYDKPHFFSRPGLAAATPGSRARLISSCKKGPMDSPGQAGTRSRITATAFSSTGTRT
ncbi:unnamed protein product [Urochloa humidicola]